MAKVIVATGNPDFDHALFEILSRDRGTGAEIGTSREELTSPGLLQGAGTVVISPLLDGSAPLEQVLYELRRKDLRVILLAGDTPAPTLKKAQDMGIHDIIADPVLPETVAGHIVSPAVPGDARAGTSAEEPAAGPGKTPSGADGEPDDETGPSDPLSDFWFVGNFPSLGARDVPDHPKGIFVAADYPELESFLPTAHQSGVPVIVVGNCAKSRCLALGADDCVQILDMEVIDRVLDSPAPRAARPEPAESAPPAGTQPVGVFVPADYPDLESFLPKMSSAGVPVFVVGEVRNEGRIALGTTGRVAGTDRDVPGRAGKQPPPPDVSPVADDPRAGPPDRRKDEQVDREPRAAQPAPAPAPAPPAATAREGRRDRPRFWLPRIQGLRNRKPGRTDAEYVSAEILAGVQAAKVVAVWNPNNYHKADVAWELSQKLKNTGKTVVLVEYDLANPELDLVMRVPRVPPQKCRGKKPWEIGMGLLTFGPDIAPDVALKSVYRYRGGIDYLPAGNSLGVTMHPFAGAGTYGEIIDTLTQKFEVVVVDVNPDLRNPATEAALKKTGTVLVPVRDKGLLQSYQFDLFMCLELNHLFVIC